GKLDIGHLLQFLEVGRDRLAGHHRLDLTLTGGAQAVLDPPQSGLYLLDADRTLFQSAQQTGTQLVLIEGLAATVLLDDARQYQFGGLEGGETFLAGQAFPAATHLSAVGYQSGVDHFGVIGAAKRTVHGRIPVGRAADILPRMSAAVK